MNTSINFPDDFRGVFAVPPLCRDDNPSRTINFAQNALVVEHIRNGGITRLIYGGNAFLYHTTLDEYAWLVDWAAGLEDDVWVIPSLGPSFGRAIDQAPLIRAFDFPCAMVLPCNDPRDAKGLAEGYRQIAEAAETKLLLYLKDETSFGSDLEEGLDAVGRLFDDGVCIGIKYAASRISNRGSTPLASRLGAVDGSPHFWHELR